MSIKVTIKKIDPKRDYNLSQITAEGLFPWAKNIRTIRKVVKADFFSENLLKAKISGVGRAADYKIKGINIMKYLEKYGPGLMIRKSERIK